MNLLPNSEVEEFTTHGKSLKYRVWRGRVVVAFIPGPTYDHQSLQTPCAESTEVISAPGMKTTPKHSLQTKSEHFGNTSSSRGRTLVDTTNNGMITLKRLEGELFLGSNHPM